MSLSSQTNHPFERDLSQMESAQNKSATERLEEVLKDLGPITSPPITSPGEGFPGKSVWIDLLDNPGDDNLVGNASDDSLYGGSGNDLLKGNGGNDSLYGGSDNDSLFGGSGNDILNGTGSNSPIKSLFGLGTSFVGSGEGEIDRLTGGQGADTFVLGEVSSFVGNVLVVGNEPQQQERVFYNSDEVKDYALITDFNSTKDTIQLAGSAADYTLGASVTGLPKGTAIYHGDPAKDEIIGVLQGVSVNDFSSGFTFVSTQDSLRGDASDDSLYGGSDNDSLKGNGGNDSLYGGSDNDSLKGDGGNDSLNGGSGNDSLIGGSGNDILNGAKNSGLFSLGDGSGEIDRLTGGRGADTFVLGEASSLYNPGFTTFDSFSYSPETIFYSNDGINDYALVTDFNLTKDIIQLAGSATDYKLGASPTGLPEGTAIYHGDPTKDEVIGILQGVSVSDFSSGFTFISKPFPSIDDLTLITPTLF